MVIWNQPYPEDDEMTIFMTHFIGKKNISCKSPTKSGKKIPNCTENIKFFHSSVNN